MSRVQGRARQQGAPASPTIPASLLGLHFVVVSTVPLTMAQTLIQLAQATRTTTSAAVSAAAITSELLPLVPVTWPLLLLIGLKKSTRVSLSHLGLPAARLLD